MGYINLIYTQKKLKKQGMLDEYLKMDRTFYIDNPLFDMAKFLKEQEGDKEEIIDIGDWSVCDHVCGGGNQHKYKGCKPPVSGFKCHKKPVKLTRACNTQPCSPGQNKNKIETPDDS